MLLDIGCDHALLPRGKPAANELLGRRAALLQAQQLMRQHTAERFEIVAIIRLAAFHQRRELLGRGKQSRVFEQEPRRERLIGCVGRHGLRVEIEEDHASRAPRLMPIAIGAAGGNEDQLARHVAERGGRQALDGRFTVAAHAMLEKHEEMPRSGVAKLRALRARCLHDLGRHPAPTGNAALHVVGGRHCNEGWGGSRRLTVAARCAARALLISGPGVRRCVRSKRGSLRGMRQVAVKLRCGPG